ncbi:uncharacterized protein A4U43_C04F13320 [Asparagus officinalis]|uniref:Uncharacterized protein n=1 Tax=Asparagus officinalis TaxID=4686 RepID=A0A5P1F584_ASPOF|nr:uncharacterized protein A4U43_C04F13320 [Asparagus officinalis]
MRPAARDGRAESRPSRAEAEGWSLRNLRENIEAPAVLEGGEAVGEEHGGGAPRVRYDRGGGGGHCSRCYKNYKSKSCPHILARAQIPLATLSGFTSFPFNTFVKPVESEHPSPFSAEG